MTTTMMTADLKSLDELIDELGLTTQREKDRAWEFVSAYYTSMLWSTNDESTPEGGEPLDANYEVEDIHDKSFTPHTREILAWWKKHLWDTEVIPQGHLSMDEQGGHDLWLTRNGHGAGFWDGDWPEPHATRFTNAAKALGERWVLVGDDDKLHIEGGRP